MAAQTKKWISVAERMPKVDRYEQYLALTEEGYVRLLAYDAEDASNGPTGWYDHVGDSGYIIAWAELDEPAGDHSALRKAWEDARGEDE